MSQPAPFTEEELLRMIGLLIWREAAESDEEKKRQLREHLLWLRDELDDVRRKQPT